MPLNDSEIRKLLDNGLIINPNYDLINPASLDIRIGNEILIENPQVNQDIPNINPWSELNIESYTEYLPFYLNPGQFILASSMEIFNIPNNICAEFRLKSSRARQGYDHLFAVWIDPGWSNSVLTMEIKNVFQNHRIPIYPGLKIGQLVFHKLNEPKISYSEVGRYNNDLKVSGSKNEY